MTSPEQECLRLCREALDQSRNALRLLLKTGSGRFAWVNKALISAELASIEAACDALLRAPIEVSAVPTVGPSGPSDAEMLDWLLERIRSHGTDGLQEFPWTDEDPEEDFPDRKIWVLDRAAIKAAMALHAGEEGKTP